jgi:hypothetical protein
MNIIITLIIGMILGALIVGVKFPKRCFDCKKPIIKTPYFEIEGKCRCFDCGVKLLEEMRKK